MAVTGWKTAASVSNVANGSSTNQWSNTGNVGSSNNAYAATANLGPTASATTSYFLRCRDFGFTTSDVPAGAVIVGFEVEVERKSSLSNRGADLAAWLSVNSAGTSADQVGTNQIGTPANIGTSDATLTVGGASALWGATLTDADVRSSALGFDYSVTNNGVTTLIASVSVDLVRARAHYIMPARRSQIIIVG